MQLNELEADITGFSMLPPSKPYHYSFIAKKLHNVKDLKGDIRKLNQIEKIVRDYSPEIIIHLAAQPILLKSYDVPYDTYMTNTIGTLNLLEAVRKIGNAKVVLNVTSDKVYMNLGARSKYTETGKLGGSDPYSSSKACSELITHAYRSSFLSGIGIATARSGNIIGGGDWGTYRLMPSLVESSIKGRKIILRNWDAVRPWTYMLDVIKGYTTLIERLYKKPKGYSEEWNFSSDYSKSVMDIVKEFRKHRPLNYALKRNKNHEDKILLLNSGKARKRLGWKPEYTFECMVRETILWYDKFYKNPKSISDVSKGLLHAGK